MKKFTIIGFLWTLFIISFAQEKVLDKAYLLCQYNHTWQFDTLENTVRDDLILLQISKTVSKSYSYYTFQSDSLRSTPEGRKVWRELFTKAIDKDGDKATSFPHKRMKSYIYKNYPQGKMTVTDGLSLQDYIYEDELNAQNWQFTDSTKTILNYSSQMATCDFRGRTWTAWFAPDIPISDGPWKFGGLPGLIMEVYDRGSQYHFTVVGLQKVENKPIIFSKTYVGSKKIEKTNRIDFLKAQKQYLMDINGYIQMETGIDLSGGQPAKIMRYDLMELDYKY